MTTCKTLSAGLKHRSNPSCVVCLTLASFSGHEYDVSGVFATNPKDAPGPGDCLW